MKSIASGLTPRPGFRLDDVKAGKYGHHVHAWNWSKRSIQKSIDLGEKGMVPLEVRFLHNPESTHAYVGAALSSVMWHLFKDGDEWKAEKVIEVEGKETKGWDFPVPGLISDLVVSMDDRWLCMSNWLQGDVRQYDIRNPAKPKLTGQVWLGGVIELSLDGKRLYVTDSLASSWDNQFYPNISKHGSLMLQPDANTETSGLKLNDRFLVDFGKEPNGPARAHEIRFPAGDSTSDVWS